MKWLEIIHIRTSESGSDKLIGELTEMLSELQEEAGPVISLLRQAQLPSNCSLHLLYESDIDLPGKTRIGELLASAAKDFGLVNHTVWIIEEKSL